MQLIRGWTSFQDDFDKGGSLSAEYGPEARARKGVVFLIPRWRFGFVFPGPSPELAEGLAPGYNRGVGCGWDVGGAKPCVFISAATANLAGARDLGRDRERA